MRTSLRNLVYRGGLWVLAQAAMLSLILVSPLFSPRVLLWPGPIHEVVGAIFLLAGLVLFASGGLALGANLTPLPHPRDRSELCTRGIYRLVRHPIYGGVILMSAGYCLLLPSMLEVLFAPVVFLFFDRKSVIEERRLRERYPGYETYSRSVRKLLPWLY